MVRRSEVASAAETATLAVVDAVALSNEVHDRGVSGEASAFYRERLKPRPISVLDSLEALVHEVAHCVSLPEPIDPSSDESALWNTTRYLGLDEANANEIHAAAITLLVIRRLGIRVRCDRARIALGMESNLLKPVYYEGDFLADAGKEFREALKDPAMSVFADECIAYLRGAGVLR
jgi:hypothetical protein